MTLEQIAVATSWNCSCHLPPNRKTPVAGGLDTKTHLFFVFVSPTPRQPISGGAQRQT